MGFADILNKLQTSTGVAGETMAMKARSMTHVNQSEKKLDEFFDKYDTERPGSFFTDATEPFSDFLASLPANNHDNTSLDFYLAKKNPERDYQTPADHIDDDKGLIEQISDIQGGHINQVRQLAAGGEFNVALVCLYDVMEQQKNEMEAHFDRAGMLLEKQDPPNKAELKEQLAEAKKAALDKFDEAAGKQFADGYISNQKKFAEEDYYRKLVLSWQSASQLQNLAAPSAPSGGVTTIGGSRALDISGVDLSQLTPLKTASGSTIKQDPNNPKQFTIETPGDTIGDILYRWNPWQKRRADAVSLAMFIKAQGHQTINFTVTLPPRMDDPEKRSKLCLKQAAIDYEAAIEAGFAPEDITIEVEQIRRDKDGNYQKSTVTYGGTGANAKSFSDLYEELGKSEDSARKGAEIRRDKRLTSQDVATSAETSPKTEKASRAMTLGLKQQLQDAKANLKPVETSTPSRTPPGPR